MPVMLATEIADEVAQINRQIERRKTTKYQLADRLTGLVSRNALYAVLAGKRGTQTGTLDVIRTQLDMRPAVRKPPISRPRKRKAAP